MTNLLKIIESRSCGYLRISFVSHWGEDLKSVLSKFGLRADSNLTEVDHIVTQRIVTAILHKDLAYGGEIVSAEVAELHAKQFLELFPKDAYQFFTNGMWHNYYIQGSLDWRPLTDATFDGGIIAVPRADRGVLGCLWVEDED